MDYILKIFKRRDNKEKQRKHVPGYIRFPIAGVSGMGASMVTQPLDLVKYRMQLSGEGGAAAQHKTFVHALVKIARKDGVTGLYRGLSANLLHQVVYATTRMGSYQVIVDYLRKSPGFDTLASEVLAAATGGCIAGTVTTPLEIAFVRIAADGRLPAPERRNYTGVFDALRRIAKEEGASSLMTGMAPPIVRSIISNAAQLISYNQTKEYLIDNEYTKNGFKCHLLSSISAGFVYSVLSCPMDVIKTRLLFMDKTGQVQLYSGMVDATIKTVRKEGLFALWSGFIPFYARSAPHTMMLFLIYEQLTYLYRKHISTAPGTDW